MGQNVEITFPEPLRGTGESYGLGARGGRSRACTSLWKPILLCVPSQKGLFAEWPQRHNESAVRPARPKALPCGSRISKSPSMRSGPLLVGVILVDGIGSSLLEKCWPQRTRAPTIDGVQRELKEAERASAVSPTSRRRPLRTS